MINVVRLRHNKVLEMCDAIEAFARRIARGVYLDELRVSGELGHDGFEMYASAWRASNEAYRAVFRPERPATLTKFRPMVR